MLDLQPNTPPSDSRPWGASEQPPSHNERAAAYHGVIVYVSPRIRIILCRNGIQYIVQRMFAETTHGEAWRGFRYFVTQKALFDFCVKRQWLCEADVRGVITGLPDTAAQYADRNEPAAK